MKTITYCIFLMFLLTFFTFGCATYKLHKKMGVWEPRVYPQGIIEGLDGSLAVEVEIFKEGWRRNKLKRLSKIGNKRYIVGSSDDVSESMIKTIKLRGKEITQLKIYVKDPQTPGWHLIPHNLGKMNANLDILSKHFRINETTEENNPMKESIQYSFFENDIKNFHSSYINVWLSDDLGKKQADGWIIPIRVILTPVTLAFDIITSPVQLHLLLRKLWNRAWEP